jgi:hypothetical protein
VFDPPSISISLLTFGDLTSYKLDWLAFMYGENIIDKS